MTCYWKIIYLGVTHHATISCFIPYLQHIPSHITLFVESFGLYVRLSLFNSCAVVTPGTVVLKISITLHI